MEDYKSKIKEGDVWMDNLGKKIHILKIEGNEVSWKEFEKDTITLFSTYKTFNCPREEYKLKTFIGNFKDDIKLIEDAIRKANNS